MSELNRIIEDLRRKDKVKIALQADSAMRVIEENTRPAVLKDYTEWLKAYMEHGGKPTHVYDFNMITDHVFVAVKDFQLPPLYDSDSIILIVPAGITVGCPEGKGHNTIYSMDSQRMTHYYVPLYNNIRF